MQIFGREDKERFIPKNLTSGTIKKRFAISHLYMPLNIEAIKVHLRYVMFSFYGKVENTTQSADKMRTKYK